MQELGAALGIAIALGLAISAIYVIIRDLSQMHQIVSALIIAGALLVAAQSLEHPFQTCLRRSNDFDQPLKACALLTTGYRLP